MKQSESQRRVAYFYNSQIGQFKYQKLHPMRPKRITMAHNLIISYGIYRDLDVYLCREAKQKEILQYHDPDYVEYLSNFVSNKTYNLLKTIKQMDIDPQEIDLNYVSSHIVSDFQLDEIEEQPYVQHYEEISKSSLQENTFKVGNHIDSPFFPGIYTFSQLSTGASIDCAHMIINDETDIAINWTGGLHHAKKCNASGFCYINDIVICILELLRVFPRVLYIDIDVHHGDGVEEAFLHSNRVMTVSFHQYGDGFFPSSGGVDTMGIGEGKYHALNIPMKPGLDDENFKSIFQSVIAKTNEIYRPNVIVLQSGADSLSKDSLGDFNLSIKGHGFAVEYVKSLGLPLILLGGGGYTVKNVARCWAFETGLCVGQHIDGQIPENDLFYQQYGPDFKLHYQITKKNDQNQMDDLCTIVRKINFYLKEIESAPSVAFHYLPANEPMDEEDDYDKNGEDSIKQIHKKQNWFID